MRQKGQCAMLDCPFRGARPLETSQNRGVTAGHPPGIWQMETVGKVPAKTGGRRSR